MHRFFVDPTSIQGDLVRLDGPIARQIARVLRLRPGEGIQVLDDTGSVYRVELTAVGVRNTEGRVLDTSDAGGEPGLKITLYQALLKADSFELVLQKGTELGVSRFVPVSCERSVAVLRGQGRLGSKLERWRRILREAAEQSERGRLPVLQPPIDFKEACDTVSEPALILWEREKSRGLKTTLGELNASDGPVASLSVFVGPEGGFSEQEVEHAQGEGIRPVSLGSRILRAETAGIAAVTAIMYELGELGD